MTEFLLIMLLGVISVDLMITMSMHYDIEDIKKLLQKEKKHK